jgi:hypothetical protein
MTVEAPRRYTARLQDDLLQDLREAAPAPASSSVPDAAGATPSPPQPPGAAAMEVRVTPRTWAGPTAALSPDGTAVVLGIGPVQIRFGRYGR